MCGSVLIDQLHVSLFLPPDTDAAVTDSVRAALDDARLPEVLADAVRTILSATPALALLTVCVDS